MCRHAGSARCWPSRTSGISATSPSLLLLEQLGPRTLQSLALVAEVVHGTPTRFDDPARFSFAHGGKDGHPFPVPLHVYDESIARAPTRARRGEGWGTPRSWTASAAGRVHARDRDAGAAPRPTSTATIAHERAIAPSLGGRTVFDDRPSHGRPPARPRGQLSLFDR